MKKMKKGETETEEGDGNVVTREKKKQQEGGGGLISEESLLIWPMKIIYIKIVKRSSCKQ